MDEDRDLKKDIMFKEWEILWKRILFADAQIDTIKNWCIVTLVGFFGFIMSLLGIDATRNIIVNNSKIFCLILYLPFLAIIFFALNEIIKQFWKLEAFERLYDFDQFFDTEKRNGPSCKQSSKYTPLFSTEEVKEKIGNRRKCIGSRMWRSTVNSLLALNFAFFYGLLLIIYSEAVS
jgi:hypothetical protein